MISDKDTAKFTVKKLLEIQAIRLNPAQPFTWASGLLSPVYCDNRLALSHPGFRRYIADTMAEIMHAHFPETEVIAGVATGAIAWGTLVAHLTGLPLVYVRAQAKKHGRQNRMEGYLPPGARVLVIEDLISTGMSSISAVRALRDNGARVEGMISIFSYGLDTAEALFAGEGVKVYHLADFQTLIEEINRRHTFSDKEMQVLRSWRENPVKWGK